jgi:predicted DNA-binding protein
MNKNQEMSKRIGLTVPDSIYAKLEKWADQDGRPLANLCNFLIEKAVREAEDKGEFLAEKPPTQGK